MVGFSGWLCVYLALSFVCLGTGYWMFCSRPVSVYSYCPIAMYECPLHQNLDQFFFLSTFNGITSGCVMQSKDSISIPKSSAISIAAFASILCDFIPYGHGRSRSQPSIRYATCTSPQKPFRFLTSPSHNSHFALLLLFVCCLLFLFYYFFLFSSFIFGLFD